MIKSSLVDVLVRLPHGVLIGQESYPLPGTPGIAMDSQRRLLKQGLNENVPRDEIESFLKQNSNLRCVRNGDVKIIDSDKRAKNINRK